jgi:hypothetical protein
VVCRLAHAVTNVEAVTSYSFRRACQRGRCDNEEVAPTSHINLYVGDYVVTTNRANRGDFPWAFKAGNNTVIHFLEPLSREAVQPLCSRFPLSDIDSEGNDVVVAASLGRGFCEMCLKKVAPETVEAIDNAARLR